MLKKGLIALAIVIPLGSLIFFNSKKNDIAQDQSEFALYMGRCSLWTKKFELIFQFPGSYCTIVPNRGVAIRHGEEMTYVDHQNKIVFQHKDVFHHGVYFDEETDELFAINAKDYEVSTGVFGLMSGIKGYNLNGDLTFEVEGEVIIDYLRSVGEKVDLHDRRAEIAVQSGLDWMLSTHLKSRQYITLANNIHVIQKDVEGTVYRKGDLLFNILYPSGVVLIDRASGRPKDWFPYYGQKFQGEESHHPMIVGNSLVVFLNRVLDSESKKPNAHVASFDLRSRELNWIWPSLEQNDFTIYSPTHGGIFHLDDEHYLVYTMYDKFVLLLNTNDFTYRYILSPEAPELENLREGRDLVDFKTIPYHSIKNFKFLNLDLFVNDFMLSNFYLNQDAIKKQEEPELR